MINPSETRLMASGSGLAAKARANISRLSRVASSARTTSVMSMKAETAPRGLPPASNSGSALP
jgi:hypothetical protein